MPVVFDFELLPKLIFDPPEKNSVKIKKEIDEIEKKTLEKLQLETDPTERKKLEELMYLLPGMKAVMDPKNPAYKAEAETMKANAINELKTTIDLVMDKAESKIAYGKIRQFCNMLRLSADTVKRVFADKGFTIETNRPLKLPALFNNYMMDRINHDLKEVRNYKDPNGTNLQNVNSIYLFTAYMNDDLSNSTNYYSRSTKELKNILEDIIQKKNLNRRSDNIGHTFYNLCYFGMSQIFNSDESRKKYDNSLAYESLRELFKAINNVGMATRITTVFANNCIEKIQKVFPDYEEALSIYNMESKLRAEGELYDPERIIAQSMALGSDVNKTQEKCISRAATWEQEW